jgi:DnaJ-class molecular chaperone
LGISKSANEKEIKKAYKLTSLRVHPDKNRAPKAEEAFKKVA